jgi:nucleoside-diphosphate-sugar epimerase
MSSDMERHVVYGTGPTGRAVIAALLRRGKQVRVVTRSGQRGDLPSQVEVVSGDATDPISAQACTRGATHVYNCTNPRDYHRWPEQFPPLQRGILAGAAANNAKLIVMENLYMYGPHSGAPMTEDMPMRGQGLRSTTRIQMTEELWAAHRRGDVRVVSGRASDLFGPYVRESLVGERLWAPMLAGKAPQVFADPNLPHSLSYIHDVGEALVTLGERDEALGRAWHIPNAPTITLREFINLVAEEIGVAPRFTAIPRPLTRLLLPVMGLVVPPMRGLHENLYQVYEPYIVDHSAYAAAFGDHATPLREAIRTTARWHQAQATIKAGTQSSVAGRRL